MSDSVTTTTVYRPSRASLARTSEQRTALVVEDHPDSREFLSVFLEGLGYAVLGAEDGKEALRMVANHPINLILTDLNLPLMDGFELVRQVRRLPNVEDPRIVMLSAYDRNAYVASALDAGCNVVLTKPVDPDKLESVLASLETSDWQFTIAH
jgi:CheY-like chemotaxis protein